MAVHGGAHASGGGFGGYSNGSSEYALKETNPYLGAVNKDTKSSTYDLVEQMQYLYVKIVKAREISLFGGGEILTEVKLGNYKGMKHVVVNDSEVMENNDIAEDEDEDEFIVFKLRCWCRRWLLQSKWIPARELTICWIEDKRYWGWTHPPDCSRTEVAELRNVCWLDIMGTIDVKNLLKNTDYGAYLVFKLKDGWSKELEQVKSSVRFVKDKDDGIEDEGVTVFLDDKKEVDTYEQVPHLRKDGWKEIKLGDFFNEGGDEGNVEMRLFETKKLHWKFGLLVKGIEVRPI
ncbi:Hypothetical predicted protein [Olea europaea subsp. europaea]|uniref:Uncharacterized protein n=1 Tax=Olea europaea subsp. europaea TaxID=158383 RepID=A0A8S0U3A2_OLEEU|nr:Hypothetical predicted protein [Olea europaea subsp. europaea]